MLTLPGLIDPHVHPRGLPTDEYKEDYTTCTKAALAGGFTTIMDMPNNIKEPTLTYERLLEKQKIAKGKIVCDVGFYFGSIGTHNEDFAKVQNLVFGLKVFLSYSTGGLIVDFPTFEKIAADWPAEHPILLHTEGDTVTRAIEISSQTGHHTHICHVSTEAELQQIIDAKKQGVHVTCGTCPHYLFLTEDDTTTLGPFGRMKPFLKTKKDQNFLWAHLDMIDMIESDHAPHTKEEKMQEIPPTGVTGLETTLGLLLTAKKEGKMTLEQIIDKCYTQPKNVFHIPTDENTTIEVDEREEWTVENGKLFTKPNWSPFDGWKLTGKVKKVFIRGEKVFENGEILAKPGNARIIEP
ncbi:MAG: amidohydrolase family protein [Patescibacteria group bacterium]|nr:amidohydrolase family protein [Patescibacteria group bacterium]